MTTFRGLLREPARLLKPVWPLALLATAAGIASGLAMASLIGAINKRLHEPGEQTIALILLLGGLAFIALAGELAGNIGNSVIGQRIIADLRIELCRRILRAPLAEIERYKPHRLLASLDRDVNIIGVFAMNCSVMIIALAIAIGALSYLMTLSWRLFIVAAVAAALDAGAQMLLGRTASKRFDTARGAYDDLQKYYRAMTDGAKELRLSRARREKLLAGQLTPTIERIRGYFVSAVRAFYGGKTVNTALFFIVLLGVVEFGRRFDVDSAALSGFVITWLFMRGPIEQIVGSLPLVAEARIGLGRVAEMSAAFTADASFVSQEAGPSRFLGRQVELRGAVYTFPSGEGRTRFSVGPASLTVNPGELIMVTGANGSGKTTLVKMLCGLYTPESGELWCDGIRVDDANRDDFRQLISAVFFDYYLFQDVLISTPAADATTRDVERYLQEFELAGKVELIGDRFSTIDLSTGQRKRLALIHLLLENRPIIVLDEWAADQDPAYRAVFYQQMLPALKRQGKTLIVVSHDDRYFDVGDRLWVLENGRIAERLPHRQAIGT